ncbi:MAG: hypothetical protein JSR86_14460 [Proteobacteria bacterium]|nr:hypothetical protein [Pseudomonadota bacterium]
MSEALEQNVSPDWRRQVSRMEMRELMEKFRREADTHRSMMLRRGLGVASEWKAFKQFLLDVGPCPSPTHLLMPIYEHEKSYGPGKVHWAPPGTKPRPAPPRPPSASNGGFGQWATLNGETVSVSALSSTLATPLQPILRAMNEGASPDKVANEVKTADKLVNRNAIWLPADEKRRETFLMAFRAWRLAVRPEVQSHATPAFLFLYTCLPVMRDSRDELMRLDLWKPLTHSKWSAREAHVAWKRYCEMLPRAQVALSEVKAYSSFSLESELDVLCARIMEAEKRLRIGNNPRPATQSAA